MYFGNKRGIWKYEQSTRNFLKAKFEKEPNRTYRNGKYNHFNCPLEVPVQWMNGSLRPSRLGNLKRCLRHLQKARCVQRKTEEISAATFWWMVGREERRCGDSLLVGVEPVQLSQRARTWSNQVICVCTTVCPLICPHLSLLCPGTYRLHLGVGSASRRHWKETCLGGGGVSGYFLSPSVSQGVYLFLPSLSAPPKQPQYDSNSHQTHAPVISNSCGLHVVGAFLLLVSWLPHILCLALSSSITSETCSCI